MSKNRFRPVPIPEKVKVNITDSEFKVIGPLGNLNLRLSNRVKIELTGNQLFVKNQDNSKKSSSHQGTMRSLISNMIEGVTKGFQKILIIEGTGYRAQLSGNKLQLFLGFSKPKTIILPSEIKCELKVIKSVEKGDLTYITIKGIDKQLVGDVAARIRKIRIPDPYKHKGVRYADEVLRKKIGKRAVVQA